MADSTWVPGLASAVPAAPARHALLVRVTHWITAICFFALLLTGIEILISHPRFYWGETGNVQTQPLFKIPIPASRSTVPTGYNFRLPDQNGWSRALHFQAAWFAVFTGLLYVIFGFVTGHFGRNLLPAKTGPYNPIQRLVYLVVIFFLFPLVIWTGLAMSPAIASVFPPIVTILGGQQSARTIHFFVSGLLAFFVLVHVIMVYRAGFWKLTRAMVTGRLKERS